MKTIQNVLDNLHERAKVSITNDILYQKINIDLKFDIQDAIYSSFQDDMTEEFVFVMQKISAPVAAISTVAGNIDNGEYQYKVGFVMPWGTIPNGMRSEVVSVSDKTTSGQISLTEIPVSTDTACTARKIYRQQNGQGDYYLVATISDNTTTTYTDNLAQATVVANGVMPLGISTPSDVYSILSFVDNHGNSIKKKKLIEGIDAYPDRGYYWQQRGYICFDPEHPYDGQTLTLTYFITIPDVTALTDELPLPDTIQDRMIKIYTKGVSFYYLAEKVAIQEYQILSSEYVAAKQEILQGGIFSN